MKKIILIILLIVLPFAVSACDSHTFSDVRVSAVSGEKIITGKAADANPTGQRILAYVTGGAVDGWQPSEFNNPLFGLDKDGGFTIRITDSGATGVTLYLVGKDVDYSSLKTVESGRPRKTKVDISSAVPVLTSGAAASNVKKEAAATSGAERKIPETIVTITGGSQEDTLNGSTEETTDGSPGEESALSAGASAAASDPPLTAVSPDPLTSAASDPALTAASPDPLTSADLSSLTATATPPPPPPFIMFYDDGAPEDAFGDIVYMGMYSGGDDGSVNVAQNDETEKITGESSIGFTYAAPGGSHWAGVMLLFAPGAYIDDPGENGPDLSIYSKLTFFVKGGGGDVKFFVECDGGFQNTIYVSPDGEWRKITLDLDEDWTYCNIPFGWACNERDVGEPGGVIRFWVDAIKFE